MQFNKCTYKEDQCEWHRMTRMTGPDCAVMCVVFFSSHPFWTSMDVPAGVTQEEGHTGFLIHLPSAQFNKYTYIHAYIHTHSSSLPGIHTYIFITSRSTLDERSTFVCLHRTFFNHRWICPILSAVSPCFYISYQYAVTLRIPNPGYGSRFSSPAIQVQRS